MRTPPPLELVVTLERSHSLVKGWDEFKRFARNNDSLCAHVFDYAEHMGINEESALRLLVRELLIAKEDAHDRLLEAAQYAPPRVFAPR